MCTPLYHQRSCFRYAFVQEMLKSSCLYFGGRFSPSCMSLRRILTKMLSLAASRGSSVPSAVAQLQIQSNKHVNILLFPATGLQKAQQENHTRLSWALCRRSRISAHRCPRRPPATQTGRFHCQVTVKSKCNKLDKAGSHLVDVLQEIQSLFEVVLVGSSVVVADVQLWRGGGNISNLIHTDRP